VAVYAETLQIKVPLDQRRHYLAGMEKLRQLLAAEQGIARFLVLEDREKLGHFVEIIEFASAEAEAALAADASFRARLAAIDHEVESLLPGEKRERRVMVDRL
jgi:quinol monooxygenase YgiN